jgi:small subunit ribosomal protein S6
MVILSPELDERQIAPTLDKFLKVITNDGGTIDNIDIWGKRRLAYEIKHRHEGYYVVIQARSEPPAMGELSRVLSLADEVIRHKVLRIPESAYGPPKRTEVAAE